MRALLHQTFVLFIFLIGYSLIASSYSYGQIASMDLIDKDHLWQGFGSAKVSQSKSALLINVISSAVGKNFDRAVLKTEILTPTVPRHLELDYLSSSTGNATFLIELRKGDISNKVLWSEKLGASSNLNPHLYVLPTNGTDKLFELRLYVITDGPGSHSLLVKKAALSPIFSR